MKPLKNIAQIVQMFLEGAPGHQYVINVYSATLGGKPERTHSISLSKVAGALHKPKGITWNCQSISGSKGVLFF